MKAMVWIVFSASAALWSGLALVTVAIVESLVTAMSTGGATDLTAAVLQAPMPTWLTPWINTEAIRSLQSGVAESLAWISALLPSLVVVTGWLVPMAWLAWGLGMVVLLVTASLGHWATLYRPSPRRRGHTYPGKG